MLAFKSLARNLEVVVSPDTNFKLPQEPVHEILRMLSHFWYFGIVWMKNYFVSFLIVAWSDIY